MNIGPCNFPAEIWFSVVGFGLELQFQAKLLIGTVANQNN
jgi:hypothetical protein